MNTGFNEKVGGVRGPGERERVGLREKTAYIITTCSQMEVEGCDMLLTPVLN